MCFCLSSGLEVTGYHSENVIVCFRRKHESARPLAFKQTVSWLNYHFFSLPMFVIYMTCNHYGLELALNDILCFGSSVLYASAIRKSREKQLTSTNL